MRGSGGRLKNHGTANLGPRSAVLLAEEESMSTTYMPSTHLINLVIALVVLAALAWFINTHVAIEPQLRMGVDLALGLVAVGICLWLINTFIPMANSIKAILNIVVIIAVCVQVLQYFGLWAPLVGLWDNLTRSLHSGAGS
jgi:hypothetical protein